MTFVELKERVDQKLSSVLKATHGQPELLEAMSYGVFNGGKRIRPILVYLTCQALGTDLASADTSACAVELIHAYSLIHDDLPAMDDDDLRRGLPTCHIQFGEATAILAGDALQTLAFEILANDTKLEPAIRLQLISTLTHACGCNGMIAGQMIDLASENASIDVATLEAMHHRKTGDMISASLQCAAIVSAAEARVVTALTRFGFALGLAFQIRDDILDVTGSEAEIGKPVGSDELNRKTTFVSVFGLEQAAQKLNVLLNEAETALVPLGDNARDLRALARFVIQRNH